jgi:hypothetical protein
VTGKTFHYPELPDHLAGKLNWKVIGVFGPGALVASVSVGTGETLFAPRLGAVFGYTALWAIPLICFFKAIQVYSGARYLVLTGEHPVKAWSRFPGPPAWFPVLLLIVILMSLPLWLAAIADALANLSIWITGIGTTDTLGRSWWSTLFLLGAFLLTQIQTYRVIEKVSLRILTLKFALIAIAVFVVQPDWPSVLWHFIVPGGLNYHPELIERYSELATRPPALEIAVFAGAVGTGLHDYIGYVGMLRQKKWGALAKELSRRHPRPSLQLGSEDVKRARKWLRAPLVDTSFSFLSVFLITACYMILGAAILHPQRLVPTDADLFSAQAQFLIIIHPSLSWLYKLGVFIALLGVIYGVFEIWKHSLRELSGAVFRRYSAGRLPNLGMALPLYATAGALIVVWSGYQTISLVSFVAPITGILGCGIWCLAMLWTDRKFLPATMRMGRLLTGLTLGAGVLMTAFGVYILLA